MEPSSVRAQTGDKRPLASLVSRAGFPSLREFLDCLRREGELVEVQAPVRAHLEIAEIHRRVIAAGGPALLFTNVEGAELPVVTNLFGTPQRADMAFGSRPFDLLKELITVAEQLVPPSLSGLWNHRRTLQQLIKIGFRTVRRVPVLEQTTREPRLDRLPALTSWPEDGGPFFTLPLVYTESSDRPGHNLGIYRMQVLSPNRTGMHWQIGKGGGFHFAQAESRGQDLPVTVFFGGPPALTLAALAPLPENVPELLLASLLLGERLPVARGPEGRRLIADCELALLGAVRAGVRAPEGPFGDHYGYYSLQHDYPVFEVQQLVRRRDAILPATVVGKPFQEDFYLGNLLQDLLSPLFPLVMPGVRSLWSYGEAGFHPLAAAVVQERYGREAMASAFRILGEGQLSLTKFLLVVDQPMNLQDFPKLLEHLLARTRVECDLFVFDHLSMDTLDYSGPVVNRGSKGVWLGLGDPVRDLPREARFPQGLPGGCFEPHCFCGGCLVLGGPPYASEPEAARRLATDAALAPWQLVVLTDEPARAAASPLNFLWTTFTRFDPAGDLHGASERIVRGQVVRTAPLVLDARKKPWYPRELFADEETAARVTKRWREYFPNDEIEMGSSDLAHLTPPR